MRWVEQRARCDQCGQEITLPNGDNAEKPLPWPWREVTIAGWVARFVACGDICEAKFKGRYERPERCPTPAPQGKSVMPTPVPSEPPGPYGPDEDTDPSLVIPGATPGEGDGDNS